MITILACVLGGIVFSVFWYLIRKKQRAKHLTQSAGVHEFRFEGDRVYVKRVGNAVVLLPYSGSWEGLFQSLDAFSDDFMEEGRGQPAGEDEREAFG